MLPLPWEAFPRAFGLHQWLQELIVVMSNQHQWVWFWWPVQWSNWLLHTLLTLCGICYWQLLIKPCCIVVTKRHIIEEQHIVMSNLVCLSLSPWMLDRSGCTAAHCACQEHDPWSLNWAAQSSVDTWCQLIASRRTAHPCTLIWSNMSSVFCCATTIASSMRLSSAATRSSWTHVVIHCHYACRVDSSWEPRGFQLRSTTEIPMKSTAAAHHQKPKMWSTDTRHAAEPPPHPDPLRKSSSEYQLSHLWPSAVRTRTWGGRFPMVAEEDCCDVRRFAADEVERATPWFNFWFDPTLLWHVAPMYRPCLRVLHQGVYGFGPCRCMHGKMRWQ
jgi:hypothetical protein